jgi:hypothetical protein
MRNGPNSPVAKVLVLGLFGVWALLVLDLTTADPPTAVVVFLTAFLFSLIGRMWGLEVDEWLDRAWVITIDWRDDDE